MPGGDRTGPQSMGARTGRAAGYCAGSGMPGYANPTPGQGLGRGFRGTGLFRGGAKGGGRRGRRNRFYATGQPGWMTFNRPPAGFGDTMAPAQYDPQQEQQTLQNQASALRAELNTIEKRLSEITPENVD